MFNVAQEEVKLLDTDLKEIYKDYGTNEIYVLKNCVTPLDIDPLYNEYVNKNTFTPYKALGMITIKDVEKENQTTMGNADNLYTYNVKILKSSLDEQGVLTLDTKDKLKYGEVELAILSVKPNLILGNYCVQYEVIANGNSIVLNGGTENGE